MHQIGKSHTGCIIKVVLAALLFPVSCASFLNVEDHSGCVLTLINLAAHHDKWGLWWEMAKSAEESRWPQTSKVWAVHVETAVTAGGALLWFSTKVTEKTAISQICHSPKPGRPSREKLQATNLLSIIWEECCLPLEASVPWGPPITSVKSFCQASFTADLKTFLL